MTDPFQDVDSIAPDLLGIVVYALESRATEADMVPIAERYIDQLAWDAGSIHIEVGAGTGAITRLLASRATDCKVIGIDPSERLIAEAKKLAGGIPNVAFEVGHGASLRFDDGSIDSVVMHTVLSHVPTPEVLLLEAFRVLKPGGKLVVCDADFEKSSIGNFDGDPLNSCAEYFVRNYVTHPYLISDIRKYAINTGFDIEDFRVDSRVMTNTDGGLGWIKMSANQMVEKGLIGEELAKALENEYIRRKDAGTLYGLQPFGTLVAVKSN
jgi:arsenite methyltransferase